MKSLTTCALLACDVFKEEIEGFAAQGATWRTTRFLEMGLHDFPDNLRSELTSALQAIEEDPEIETVLLAYGRCGNGLVGLRAGRARLVLPQAHDCLSILLGGREEHDAALRETPGTYFYSPGWIRGKRVPGPDREDHLRELYRERYPDDEEMLDDLVEVDRESFAHNSCAAYVDITGNAEAEAYCKGCAHHMGWSFKRLPGDPSFLEGLLSGPWDDPDRFLIIPPGHHVDAREDGTLFARDPR